MRYLLIMIILVGCSNELNTADETYNRLCRDGGQECTEYLKKLEIEEEEEARLEFEFDTEAEEEGANE